MVDIKLMQGDCMERMKDIPDGSIDLTVTSPPYDNLRTYNGNNVMWCEQVWKDVIVELFRVTKDGGVVVWVVGDATVNGSETGTSFKQALWSMDCGFKLHDTMIWEKPNCQFPNFNRYYSVFEYMFVFSKGKPKTANLITDRKNKYSNYPVHSTERRKDGTTTIKIGAKKGNRIKENGVRFNVWKISNETNSKVYGHPAMFPVAIPLDHIATWSNQGDIILDPFMGSGTTGVACVRTNRNFIGIELDEGYFNIAKERIHNEQPPLV